MSRIIILHDHTNPANEVPVDADQITLVIPAEDGSSVHMGNNSPSVNIIQVHETPDEVTALWKAVGHPGQWK